MLDMLKCFLGIHILVKGEDKFYTYKICKRCGTRLDVKYKASSIDYYGNSIYDKLDRIRYKHHGE